MSRILMIQTVGLPTKFASPTRQGPWRVLGSKSRFMHWILCDKASWEWHGVTVHHRLPKWCHWARVLNAELPFTLDGRANLKRPLTTLLPMSSMCTTFLFGAGRETTAMAQGQMGARHRREPARNHAGIRPRQTGVGALEIRPSWAELQARALNDVDHVVLVK